MSHRTTRAFERFSTMPQPPSRYHHSHNVFYTDDARLKLICIKCGHTNASTLHSFDFECRPPIQEEIVNVSHNYICECNACYSHRVVREEAVKRQTLATFPPDVAEYKFHCQACLRGPITLKAYGHALNCPNFGDIYEPLKP